MNRGSLKKRLIHQKKQRIRTSYSKKKMASKMTTNLFELQFSLENSLCVLTKKQNTLSRKLSNAAYPEKKDEKSKASSSDNGEKSDKPYKKLKLASEKAQKSSFSARAKGKRAQPAKSQENGFSGKSDVPKVQKNDSSRFWSFLDCYCCDLSSETVKVLDQWIESHEKDSDYQNIPELGSHYSSKIMEDNLLEEKIEGTKSMENAKGTNFSLMEENELELLSKVQDTIQSLHPEQPPLAEKLLSTLVQENIITSPNDIMTESTPDDNIKNKRVEEKLAHTSSSLENRLRKELTELGILDKNYDEESDDELLQELKSLQTLLIPLSDLNLKKKKALLSRAKAEISKQEAQKRIQEMDAKVMENYRMMTSARSKGKKLSKKELSHIRNILEERDTLIKNTKIAF